MKMIFRHADKGIKISLGVGIVAAISLSFFIGVEMACDYYISDIVSKNDNLNF